MHISPAELDKKLDLWIETHQDNMIKDIVDLVAIPSLRLPATRQYPFGEVCAKALDHTLNLCKEYGFSFLENKDYYYGTCLLKGEKGDKSIGIICHLDIVPAEEPNWKNPPFEAYVENGYIVGRGTTDNKGPLVASLYVLRFLKENGIKLQNDVMLVLGCDEESGMEDMAHFVANQAKIPAFSLVPDAPWPICHAEKGRIAFSARADILGENLASFCAGEVANSTPGHAQAVLSGLSLDEVCARLPKDEDISAKETSDGILVSANGLSKHTSTPEGCVDALHKLAFALSSTGLLSPKAQDVVTALAHFSSDFYGAAFGIAAEDDVLGKLTHSCSLVKTQNGQITFMCDVRYPICAKWDTMLAGIKNSLAKTNFVLEKAEDNPPNYMPANEPIVQNLAAIANRQMGTNFPPATMGGGTYARKVPNAVGYGPSRPDIKKPFAPGHGWAHQVNEGVRIQNLIDLIRAYSHALIYLDETV